MKAHYELIKSQIQYIILPSIKNTINNLAETLFGFDKKSLGNASLFFLPYDYPGGYYLCF